MKKIDRNCPVKYYPINEISRFCINSFSINESLSEIGKFFVQE